jgi:hypothetical protein
MARPAAWCAPLVGARFRNEPNTRSGGQAGLWTGKMVSRSPTSAAHLAFAIGASAERLDLLLRRWPVAASLLLILAGMLAAFMLATG